MRAAISGAGYEERRAPPAALLPYLHRVGNLDELARVCGTAGYVGDRRAPLSGSARWLDEALDAARLLDDPGELFVVEGNRGLARLFLHELEDAGQHFCDALAACRDAGHEDDAGVDETLLGLAAVEASRTQLARAARLTGAATAHQARHGFVDEEIVWSRWSTTSPQDATATIPSAGTSPSARERTLTVHDAIDLALERGRFARIATTTH